MSRKRRQRSTTIRKRIEKKQREAQKAKRRQAKASGGRMADVLVRIIVERPAAESTSIALADLAARLAVEPIRGWTPADLGGEMGLGWLAEQIKTTLAESSADPLEVDVLEAAKSTLLEALGALEMAATGLKVDWEEGFTELYRAVGRAEELPPELEELEDEDDESGESEDSADESATEPATDEAAS